jgi:hypothetical protein
MGGSSDPLGPMTRLTLHAPPRVVIVGLDQHGGCQYLTLSAGFHVDSHARLHEGALSISPIMAYDMGSGHLRLSQDSFERTLGDKG